MASWLRAGSVMSGLRVAVVWSALVAGASCVDAGRALEPNMGSVEVAPPQLPPVVSPGPLGVHLPPAPQLVYAEPTPLPVTHAVRVTLRPTGALRLSEVQSAEIEVDVSGGAVGAREVSVLFVSPQGLAWERQARRVELSPGATATARFTLPVANTFIEDQGLSGRWSLTTLEDGAEQASASFEVAP